jgi:hypothetical protein
MRRFLTGAIVLSAVVLIVSALYLMPETNCEHEYDPPEGSGFSQLLCLRPESNNPWERISGAITEDDPGH